MKRDFVTFQLERVMSVWEYQVEYNLSESGVHPMTMLDLFAGDKGFNFPELNEAALKGLDEQTCSCEAGYSTSITCETGLSLHAGIPYRSILYLVDEVTQPNTITT